MENEDTKVNFFECTYICSTRFFRSQLLIFAHELTAVGFPPLKGVAEGRGIPSRVPRLAVPCQNGGSPTHKN